jgi:hypothetical protein
MMEEVTKRVDVLIVSKWEDKEDAILTPDKLIRVNPKKKEFGSIMLINETMGLGDGGFLNPKTKFGFIPGRVVDLQKMLTMYGLKAGTNFSEKVAPHRIITTEVLATEVPENEGFRVKLHGETKPDAPNYRKPLTKGGIEIWWRTSVVPQGSEKDDQLIEFDREPKAVGVETDPAIAEFTGEAPKETKSK